MEFKITSASSLSSSEKKCSVSVESALDLDCNDVNSNCFCDPKTCGVLWEDVLVLQGPSYVTDYIFLFQSEKLKEMESTPTYTQNTKVIVNMTLMQVIHKEMSLTL